MSLTSMYSQWELNKYCLLNEDMNGCWERHPALPSPSLGRGVCSSVDGGGGDYVWLPSTLLSHNGFIASFTTLTMVEHSCHCSGISVSDCSQSASLLLSS